jgi:hypothetical protein
MSRGTFSKNTSRLKGICSFALAEKEKTPDRRGRKEYEKNYFLKKSSSPTDLMTREN